MLTVFKKTSIMTFLMMLFISMIMTPVYAAPDYLYLNIDGEVQEQTNWCWAACSKSVISYTGHGIHSQSDIVTSVKGSPINEGATYDEDGQSITNFGASTSGKMGYISYSILIDCIKNWYSPIKVALKYQAGGGHGVVIYGYYDDTFVNNLSYMDPKPDNPRWNTVDYDVFKNNGTWYWNWTYYYID